MSDIRRRINTIEKKVSLGRYERPTLLPFIVCLESGNSPREQREALGPIETWITYQEQLQVGTKANAEYLKDNPGSLAKFITIELDAEKEYQARATKNNQKQLKAEKLSQQDE